MLRTPLIFFTLASSMAVAHAQLLLPRLDKIRPLPVAAVQADDARFDTLAALYADGNYSRVAREGLALLLQQPWNHELRLKVANSLAWTGQEEAALVQYETLLNTGLGQQAALGIANIRRWNGRPDKAVALYQQALNANPQDREATEGLALARRQLRAKTSVVASGSGDSDHTQNRSGLVNHKWKDADGVQTFEVETSLSGIERPGIRKNQSDLTVRYANPDALLEPQVELSAQATPKAHLFGTLSLKLSDTPVSLNIGHVNWGKMAFNPNALRDDLSATQLGGALAFSNRLGRWRVNYNAFMISDDNLVQDARLQYFPLWQPFSTPDIKLYGGLEARKARTFDLRYWSPQDGNYAATLGVNAEWQSLNWQNYLNAQYGFAVGGEAAGAWSVNAGSKRQLGEDWALGIDLSAISSQRSGAYKAHAVGIQLEKLW